MFPSLIVWINLLKSVITFFWDWQTTNVLCILLDMEEREMLSTFPFANMSNLVRSRNYNSLEHHASSVSRNGSLRCKNTQNLEIQWRMCWWGQRQRTAYRWCSSLYTKGRSHHFWSSMTIPLLATWAPLRHERNCKDMLFAVMWIYVTLFFTVGVFALFVS